MAKNDRYAGILLHPTSFPSPFGIGDLGEDAYRFIDECHAHKVRLWQTLPLGPVGSGDSPYSARSSFAGSELLISPRTLYLDGYLDIEDLMIRPVAQERVDYEKAREIKEPLLRKAAKNFLKSGKEKKEYQAFLKESAWWLEDYALYRTLTELYGDSKWYSTWPEEVRKREPGTLASLRKEYRDEIELWCILQYFFKKEWSKLKAYANERDVRIIGDIPIFVAYDSCDAWCNTRLLKIDGEGKLEKSSGVPPDAFSAAGQNWGNPLYRWEEHEKEGFSWWIKRLERALELSDIVRIDHFRGFESCWEIPAGEETAMNGKWVKSPGEKILSAFREHFGKDLPIIAEDLGIITPEVTALREKFGLPGMKILQFAFGFDEDGAFDDTNAYLPHNIERNSVVYTGTHDNDTTVGWYESLSDREKDAVRRYFECADDQASWQMIRHALVSNAKWCIIPMQDLLMLDSSARMNVPSTCGCSNWSWRVGKDEISTYNWSRLEYMIKLYGRD